VNTVVQTKVFFEDKDIEKLIEEAQEFVNCVAKRLKVKPPKVKRVFIPINARLPTPKFRGVFDPETNTIGLSLLYGFSSLEDAERTVRHEIAEWLSWLITGENKCRLLTGHRDRIFRKIFHAVYRYYPEKPEKLAEYIESVCNKFKEIADF